MNSIFARVQVTKHASVCQNSASFSNLHNILLNSFSGSRTRRALVLHLTVKPLMLNADDLFLLAEGQQGLQRVEAQVQLVLSLGTGWCRWGCGGCAGIANPCLPE